MWIFAAATFIVLFISAQPTLAAENSAQPSLSSSAGSRRLPPGTLELIRAQTLKAKDLALQKGATDAQDELRKVENQIKAEHDKIARLENALGGRGDQQSITPQELQEMRNRLTENIERIKQTGETKAALKEQESQAKADDLQRQADALEKQILRSGNQQDGELKVNPVGTNLYVRNYMDVRPPAKPLHATQQVLPAVRSINKQTAAVLRSRALSNFARLNGGKVGAKVTHTDVRGILIKP